MNNNPIAVVDSGAGGLACLDAIRSEMPGEDIIFFGDTKHMPYGTKTDEELKGYMLSMCEYFKKRNVKMIILACGTLSSVAETSVYEALPTVLVQGVVQPGAAYTSRTSDPNLNRIGVIATQRTIDSGSYQKLFEGFRKKYEVFYKACPGLASLIEGGTTDGPEMEALLREYLDEMINVNKVDTLLLGCTHYPLASACISRLYPSVRIINPAEILARNAQMLLSVHELDADEDRVGSLEICVSKKTDGIVKTAEMLGYGNIPIEEVSL